MSVPRVQPEAGQELELRVRPEADVTRRYADVSGDSNPIHLDPEFARGVGLPGIILHGLYVMAQVARANAPLSGGDPRALKRLKVTFRGMAVPEEEILVSVKVDSVEDGTVATSTNAVQGATRLIRGAEAELRP